MEYIEREAIVNNSMLHTWKKADLLKAIKDAPSADVATVRHGRWADGKCTVCGWEEPDVCSYDGYEAESWIHTPYCPMCGALMDGCETDA